MNGSPSLASPIPTFPHQSPSPSPRRESGVAGPSSPRLPRASMGPRLPSISATQPMDYDSLESPSLPGSRTSVVMGFSPVPSHQTLPAVPEASSSSPRAPGLTLNTSHRRLNSLSPQLTTPVEQVFQWAEGSPRPLAISPRGLPHDLPPRSRRNSAAIVSISLSSRSRSRTPRGSAAALPNQQSGSGTPNKGSSSATPKFEGHKDVMVQMGDSWASGADDMDDWQPAGGMLLDGEDSGMMDDEDRDEFDDNDKGRSWTGFSDDSSSSSSPHVEEPFKPGMLIGEGMEFQGEIIIPAVGRMPNGSGSDDVGLPLRRGGSEATKNTRTDGKQEKKRYEVVRKLGTGSYAVVYLVREKGGRHREFALKCLSKQDLEEEQLETQLFEAHIHLSLPIHQNIVTLHQTLQTRKWLFLMLELCPGEDLFYWLEKSRDASPHTQPVPLPGDRNNGVIGSPASLLFAHHNGHSHSHHFTPSQTPPTPSLLSSFSAGTLLSPRRLRLIASMFSQMCEAVSICHDAGISHRDIKPENFICCDSIELESAVDGELGDDDEEGKPVNFGPQAKRKVVVKLTDFGLATTEEESGDVECGSKPYMSYECRNNLGPTYFPAPADVWSLGIVLINMLFHRNPWKDPTPGDPNFDNFLMDPIGFLLTKFSGVGKEVASYLADHVLCIDVDARVSAREFGLWIKNLPEMIAGKKALYNLKMSRKENQKTPTDKGLFVKSPIASNQETARKNSSSALTSSAPGLSSLPPASQLSHPQHIRIPEEEAEEPALSTPPLEHDQDELVSATTFDDQPTPVDTSEFASPETVGGDSELYGDSVADASERADGESRSLSTHKRRKRGVRKGKAAKAAALAAAGGSDQPSQEERDALLAELTVASQTLAREVSKFSKPSEDSFDATKIEDFPPLGTTPAQAAEAKKSKWKDMMKFSTAQGNNPELAALARRVAERDGSLNLSAPANLQQGEGTKGSSLIYSKHALRQTTTVSSSGISSALSSFGNVSSTSATSSAADEVEDWRKPRKPPVIPEEKEQSRGRDTQPHHRYGRNEDHSRARKAAMAAAAITGGFNSEMGSFGKPSNLSLSQPIQTQQIRPSNHPPPVTGNTNYTIRNSAPIGSSMQNKAPYKSGLSHTHAMSIDSDSPSSASHARPELIKKESSSTITSTQTPSNTASTASAVGPNKPKLKGQIHTLAKMLSGLKTNKGKD
uniref:Serine/threonine protein kinase n=1 Tax=Kwoniella bestiolae CBS 10118 TaxID=1296100 RepID=A0A1B9G8N9_9TREE|nr:serine/threonine protein kinase [Kwoniella bestiolae CBS 10118]OCF27350.1 serine/threonine protein kinase [Kwoniella bestiolae CBS 10118]